MQFHQRLVRGLLSSLASRSVSIATQLVTIPVLARTWGVEIYGEYLTMVAIASYLPLLTLGVHQSALSEMSIAHSKDEPERYANVLRGLFQMVGAITLGGLVVHGVISVFADRLGLLPGNLTPRTYALLPAVFFIGFQQIASQNLGVATNGIAALGRYGEAQIFDTLRLSFDSLLLWSAVLLLDWGPDRTAAVSAGITALFVLAAWVRLRALTPTAHNLLLRVDWRGFADLWKPVVGNFVMTNGYTTLIVQGPRLLLAATAGPAGVATFAIVWTLLGIFRQAFEVLMHPLSVEFAYAFGANAKARAEKMLILGAGAALGVCLLAAPVVLALGQWIIGLATKGKLTPPIALIGVMWSVLAVYAATVTFHVALISSNRSHVALLKFVFWTALSAGLAVLLGRQSGLYGVAVGLLVFQLGFSAILVTTTVKVFDLDFRRMMRELLNVDPRALFLAFASRASEPE